MSNSPTKRKRIYVSRKRYDKVDKFAKEEEGLTSAGQMIDDFLKDLIDENEL